MTQAPLTTVTLARSGSRACVCGRTISANKKLCMDCFQEFLQREQETRIKAIAERIPDQATLERALLGATDSERSAMLHKLRPHLQFSLDGEAA